MSSTQNTSPWRHCSEWHTSTSPAQTFILTARTSLEGPSHLSMFSTLYHNPPSPPHTQAGRQTHSRPKVPLVLKGRRREKRWTGISSISICNRHPLPIPPLPVSIHQRGTWLPRAEAAWLGYAWRGLRAVMRLWGSVSVMDGWLVAVPGASLSLTSGAGN